MALEDDLKARTLALISQQMANWVVEIQRSIQGHQAALVRSLDELQETVARYDEKVDEREIGAAVSEVLAQQAPAAGTADYSRLRASMATIEKGTSLSEVLTHLVTEVAGLVDRAAMFIIKGQSAIGWYARGFDRPEAIKSVNVPLTADTVIRLVHNSRHAERGHIAHTPGTAQAISRMGGDPQGLLAVPLLLRDKVAAVLYCDTPADEIPPSVADAIEILSLFAAKVVDVLSAAPKTATAPGIGGTGPGLRGTGPGLRGTGPGVRAPVAPPPPAPAAGLRHPATPPPAAESASSTVMFTGPRPAAPPRGSAPPLRPAAFTPAPPVAVPTTGPTRAITADQQKAHEDAKRFARLVVSEIKLYNESKVAEGRKTRDIYERLKEDIERGRQMYHDRVPSQVREVTDYFHEELVRILAGGDANALGPV